MNDIRSGFDGRPVADYQQAIATDPLHTRVNSEESLLDHKLRILAFLNMLHQQDLRCVLIVCHEEGLRVISGYFLQLDDMAMIAQHFRNCQIQEYEFSEATRDCHF